MTKLKRLFFLLSALLLLIPAEAQNNKVYYGEIVGDIDLGLVPYVKRVIDEAEENLADAVIFKVNTFGGRVDAATQIKDVILNSEVLTIAFIDKRAISAGALISLSCEKIVMVPGASIGASTVVDQAGKKQAEKYQSYMRSEMRSTAEKNGRPTDIAEGMVDERIVVEGLVDSTQLITLTTNEAIEYGIADTSITSVKQVLSAFDMESADLVVVDSNWAEGVVRFLNNPVITSLLIMIGIIGLFAEVKSPGWGVPGTASLIALALFFGSSYILDLASIFEIIVFVIGVGFLIAEVFFLPGFGIFGILGIILIIASLFLGLISDFPIIDYSLLSTAIIQLAVALSLSLISMIWLWKMLPNTTIFRKLVLQENISGQSGYTSDHKFEHLLSKRGIALTDLRPSGTVIIDDKRIDVVTEGEYITKNKEVEVILVEGSKIVVHEIKLDS